MKQDLWQYLKSAEKPIVLYGMGNGADKIIDVLESYSVTVSGVFATDGFVRDKVFRGFNLSTYDKMKEKFGDMIVLLCFGSARDEVLNNLTRISAENELFAPDVPVFGGGLFNLEYAKQNSKRLENIYSRLADEKSRQTFQNVVYFKLSGKLDYLFECEVDIDEPFKNILKLTDNEVFLDLGAYKGDTVEDFLKRVNSYKSVTAVEPDIKSYKKLVGLIGDNKKITPINACVSDISGEAPFSMKNGRNSSLGEGELIRSVTVDEVGSKSTYIKMDIEGAELKAIYGAENTIKQNKPKLQIAAYHRTEDLFTIPEAVFKIRDDYKLYIRHNPCVPAWDLNYYFI